MLRHVREGSSVFTVDLEMAWCEVCCSQHGGLRPCPGHVDVDEPERRGRCFVARSGKRVEHYQTLVAPTGELWRARIFTRPGKLWGVPDGEGTAKFYDDTETDAERQAVKFIYRRCRSLGLDVSEVATDAIAPPDDTSAGRRTTDRRYDRWLPALFGIEVATHVAYVSNVSRTGVFLATDRPLPVGQRVNIVLHSDHFTIPLVGNVTRIILPSAGREAAGMDVELDDPPFRYLEYISKLEP